jgi:dipeptidyl aminopeptidase/acylaminoacyl peptidase
MLFSGITISHILYPSGKSKMEALIFKPLGNGPFPALVMIHGHSQDCFLFKESGKGYAKVNYLVFAPSMVGYGRSKGYSDFGGPKTLNGILDGFEYLKSLSYVDKRRIGIYGFSRGAHAGSLLVTQSKDIKGAVFVGGIYDFRVHYDWASVHLPGIKKIIEDEVGVSKKEWAKRSVINYIENIECPILIIHGEKDERTSVEQARIFADALSKKQKYFELFIVPGSDHVLRGVQGIMQRMLEFYGKYLQ